MVTLIVAGMGILGTLLAPLLNGWQNRQSERQKWARESKIEAYAAFAAKAEETGRRILHHPHFGLYSPEDLAQMTESHRSQTQVNLDTQLADWDELLTAFNKVILFGSMPV